MSFAVAVLRGDVDSLIPEASKAEDVEPEELLKTRLLCIPTIRERLEAKRWLAERGYGKPREAPAEDSFANLSNEELAEAIAGNPELMASILSAQARLKANAPASEAIQ